MASNKCGTLSSLDLSNIRVSLREFRYDTEKTMEDATNDLQKLKKSGESDTVIANVTNLVNQATEIYTDRIKSIEETEKKITECIRG